MANRDNKRRESFRSRHNLDRQSRAALEMLASFSQVLEIVDIDAVLEFVVQRSRSIFDCDGAAILLLSDEGSWLTPQTSVGLPADFHAQRVPVSPDELLRAYVGEEAAPATRDSVGVALAGGEGMQSTLSAPLLAEGAYLGALQVYSRLPHGFIRDDHALLGALARYAAQAIGNARRHGREQLIKRDLEQAYSELLTTLTELERAQQRLVRTERLRTLGELASSVAHDFNNLLAGILGNAQILLADADEPQRQMLEVIEQAALDGRALVRRLQEFTNKRPAAPPPTLIDIASVVDGALAIARPRWLALSRHGIEIAVRRDVHGALLVMGSAPELREVLINLLVNAIDAMPRGGTLTVRAMPCADAPASTVVLEVADSGIGIAPSLQSAIFEPFFTTKSEEEGSGLGLAISKSIIEHHGGSITVESEVGAGTCFRITLPEAEG
jgi:signal transduction histidine kinase